MVFKLPLYNCEFFIFCNFRVLKQSRFTNIHKKLMYKSLRYKKHDIYHFQKTFALCTFAKKKFMSSFYKLNIKEVKRETEDAVSILFNVPEELQHNYTFE